MSLLCDHLHEQVERGIEETPEKKSLEMEVLNTAEAKS